MRFVTFSRPSFWAFCRCFVSFPDLDGWLPGDPLVGVHLNKENGENDSSSNNGTEGNLCVLTCVVFFKFIF